MKDISKRITIGSTHLIRLCYCGYAGKSKSFFYKRENSDTFIFEYVLSGKGYITIGDKLYQLREGEMYIIPNGRTYEYFSDIKEPYERKWFNGTGELLNNFYKTFFSDDDLIICKCNKKLFEKIYELLMNYEDNNDNAVNLIALICNLFTDAYFQNKSPALSRNRFNTNTPLAERIKKHIVSHTYDKFSLDELCEELGLSKNYIISAFKKCYGVTPQVFHTCLKIDAAEEMLKNTIKSRKDIAYELDFCDDNYFSYIFKKYKGYPPSEVRHKHIE